MILSAMLDAMAEGRGLCPCGDMMCALPFWFWGLALDLSRPMPEA